MSSTGVFKRKCIFCLQTVKKHNSTKQSVKSKARPKKVIIKLSKRKDVFSTLQRKKKLKSVGITRVAFLQGYLVFHKSKPRLL